MDWIAASIIVFLTLLLVITFGPRAGKKTRRIASSAMAEFEEVFSPANYSSRVELEEQNEKVIPNPSPEGEKR